MFSIISKFLDKYRDKKGNLFKVFVLRIYFDIFLIKYIEYRLIYYRGKW